MTLDDLRQLAERLPAGAAITLPADELRDAFANAPAPERPPPDIAPAAEHAEEWLTAEQCSKVLNVSLRWIYDHAAELGVKRLSRRCVRFSSRAVARRMTRKSA